MAARTTASALPLCSDPAFPAHAPCPLTEQHQTDRRYTPDRLDWSLMARCRQASHVRSWVFKRRDLSQRLTVLSWAAPSLWSGHALLVGSPCLPGYARTPATGATRRCALFICGRASPPMRVTVVAAQLRHTSRVPEPFRSDVPIRNGVTQPVTVSVCARSVPRDF
jgi:hypothetical protein